MPTFCHMIKIRKNYLDNNNDRRLSGKECHLFSSVLRKTLQEHSVKNTKQECGNQNLTSQNSEWYEHDILSHISDFSGSALDLLWSKMKGTNSMTSCLPHFSPWVHCSCRQREREREVLLEQRRNHGSGRNPSLKTPAAGLR